MWTVHLHVLVNVNVPESTKIPGTCTFTSTSTFTCKGPSSTVYVTVPVVHAGYFTLIVSRLLLTAAARPTEEFLLSDAVAVTVLVTLYDLR